MDGVYIDEILQCMKSIYLEIDRYNYDYDWHKVHGFNQICEIIFESENRLSNEAINYLIGKERI